MKSVLFILLLFFIAPNEWRLIPDGAYKKSQLRYQRVRKAYQNKSASLKNQLLQKGINSYEFELFVRVFKFEEKLETWIKYKNSNTYILFKTYDFCAASGVLGPKREQGDLQVPEGFYFINRFNPVSSFHLSLGIDYPNASDIKLGENGNLGGDIFIHGACASIGCVAITNEWIEELYILAVEAKTHLADRQTGQQHKIPVHIFPSKNMKNLCTERSTHQDFWCNLKMGFDLFENNKTTVYNPKINNYGNYIY